MTVTLIASTFVDSKVLETVVPAYVVHAPRTEEEKHGGWSDGDALAEFAGRSCYESWTRPNPATATNQGYLKNILDQRHFSVLEHASATFYVTGVSRALLTELERHRHLSYSVLSQRFVDGGDYTAVFPPAVEPYVDEELPGWSGFTVEEAFNEFQVGAQLLYRALGSFLQGKGLTRKQAREAARSVLPNMAETKIVVTGNHRAWREVIAKRSDPHADAEIQQFAKEVLALLKDLAPNTYQDMM